MHAIRRQRGDARGESTIGVLGSPTNGRVGGGALSRPLPAVTP